MRSALQAAASRLPSLLHKSATSLGVPFDAPAGTANGLQACWFRGSQGAEAGNAGVCATAAGSATAGNAGQEEELGDLRPGMSLSEEEDDEAEHYSVRAHVHRRRLRLHEERHLDEEDSPPEEAPGEEAYKDPGPLLPPESEEEDVVTDEEEEARK